MAITRDYKDTIDKLFAKAAGAGTADEAKIFTDKAMELMAKHGVDQAMLDARRREAGGKAEEIVTRLFTIRNPYSEAKAMMVAMVAMHMRCRAIIHPDRTNKSTGSVTVIGFESDVDRAFALCQSLVVQLTHLVVKQRDPYFSTPTATWRRNWAAGFTNMVAKRVSEFEVRAASAAASETETGALVLVDRDKQVDDWYNKRFGHLRYAKKLSSGAAGYGDGREAGRNADMDFGNRVTQRRTAIGA